MIQRKQTLFLLLSIILCAACLSMPIAKLEPIGMGMATIVWNVGTVTPDAGIQFGNWYLFALLSFSIILEMIAIFLYKRRILQAKLCSLSIVLCLAWYICYAICIFTGFEKSYTFHIQFATCLPLVSIIAIILARRGIMQDEKLVRSAERIR